MTLLQKASNRPYLSIAVSAFIVTALFSFLVFPRIINVLKVYYMHADGYYPIAENLWAGNGFYIGDQPRFDRGAFKREPIYPLLLATTVKLPTFPVPLVLLQIFIHICAGWMAYKLFLEFGRTSVAFAAALLFALFPLSFWYVAKPTPENIMPFLLLLNVWLCHRYFRDGSLRMLLLWAVSCGICVLSKSNMIILFPIGLSFVWLTKKWSPALAGQTILAGLVFGLTLSPWIIRNYRLSGQPIWGSSMMGTSFFVGNTDTSWSAIRNLGAELKGEEEMSFEWKKVYADKLKEWPAGSEPDKYVLEAQVDKEFSKRVRPWIMEHPGLFIKKLAINLPTFWFMAETKRKTILVLLFETPLMFFALLGIAASFKKSWMLLEWHMMAMMCCLYLIYAAILADARYFHLFLPFVCYFACVGFTSLWESAGQARS